MSKYLVPIGILIATVLIIIGGYMLLNPGQKTPIENNNTEKDKNFIEESKSTSMFIPEVKVKADELKLNSEVPFKKGNKYKYETKIEYPMGKFIGAKDINDTNVEKLKNFNMRMSMSTEIEVDRIERYNKSDCFVLKYLETMKYENLDEMIATWGEESNNSEEVQQKTQMVNMFREGMNMSGEIWINKEGKVLKSVQKIFDMEITMTGEKAEQSMSTIGGSIIQPWMLALNENFEWTKETTSNIAAGKDFKKVGLKSVEKYKVVGIEDITTKAGKRKCYKVEAESKTESQEKEEIMKLDQKSVMWVDYNKRILVKAEVWMENLKISDMELVYEKS